MSIAPSDKPIMVKAIEKARKNGWRMYGWTNYLWTEAYGIPTGLYNPDDDTSVSLGTNDIIYNHDFAKALWGEPRINAEPVAAKDGGNTIEFEAIEGWQFHLQQMVIANDPIKYLGENLDD
jgi:hypothetical protein